VILWWREASDRLPPPVVRQVSRAELVYVSAASAWEVAIKQALGKLRLPESFAKGVDDSGFARLAVEFEHAALAGALPPHHEDPFDRLLIAQSQLEDLTLVTHDRRFEPYGGDVLWV
jgi:PIN domain nuclease of toxin-antitoxin system